LRILYFDIDSQRPDHLGCYGYHRKTSPNIDRIAARGVRFENYYVSDAPCLPSRTALWSGRFGIHNGVINHGGVASELFNDGINRGFRNTMGMTGWMRCLQQLGLKTTTISPFGERHSAFHWYAGFNEMHNTGKGGMERADEIAPLAMDWIKRNGRDENWFLHVNLWDPHTPYRTPAEFGEPFADQPLPKWLTEEVRLQHWNGCGPHSAREVHGFVPGPDEEEMSKLYPRQPSVIDSMAQVRRMFDGYDTGVLYADQHIGQILNTLADQKILDDTVIIISADHGETLGEMNIYGDHQLADHITCRVPLIVAWPGVTKSARVDSGLHYHVDFAATMIELLGGSVPGNWDGLSFAPAFRNQQQSGRDFLVLSQGAWSCQRAVRWGDRLCIRSYHDGYHGFNDVMLFDLKSDPHEQHDLAAKEPKIVAEAQAKLEEWLEQMMRASTSGIDPMQTVLAEGGAFHTRGLLPKYLARLRATGRGAWADRLTKQHPAEAM
jgi:arylsulfatase A-like enzyme